MKYAVFVTQVVLLYVTSMAVVGFIVGVAYSVGSSAIGVSFSIMHMMANI